VVLLSIVSVADASPGNQDKVPSPPPPVIPTPVPHPDNPINLRYQATEKLPAHVEGVFLNEVIKHKNKQFYDKVQEIHDTSGRGRGRAKGRDDRPAVVAAQYHAGDHTIYHSSTANGKIVNHPAMMKAVKSEAFKKTEAARGCEHWKDAVCAEGGTTKMIEDKYSKDVSMEGDKLSAYGLAKNYDGRRVLGHHAGCTRLGSVGCTDVLNHNGIQDLIRTESPDTGRVLPHDRSKPGMPKTFENVQHKLSQNRKPEKVTQPGTGAKSETVEHLQHKLQRTNSLPVTSNEHKAAPKLELLKKPRLRRANSILTTPKE
jgi:hypothetical protein